MSKYTLRSAVTILITTTLLAITLLIGQTVRLQGRSHQPQYTTLGQRDSTDRARFSSVDEIARRVDSLQFIVVYNADLLRSDINSKVTWIFIMLGVMIVASVTMFAALRQVHQQRAELEGKFGNQLSEAVSQLESQIKAVSQTVERHHPKPSPRAPKKKRS